jgi:hypothetical protein
VQDERAARGLVHPENNDRSDTKMLSRQLNRPLGSGSGTIITGNAANGAKQAALAAGYKGTVKVVMKLPDGSYDVHLFALTGPRDVFVTKDFEVIGSA